MLYLKLCCLPYVFILFFKNLNFRVGKIVVETEVLSVS